MKRKQSKVKKVSNNFSGVCELHQLPKGRHSIMINGFNKKYNTYSEVFDDTGSSIRLGRKLEKVSNKTISKHQLNEIKQNLY